MAHPSKRKGDRAEREFCKLWDDLTGTSPTRMLGAGRLEDIGDTYGIPDTTVQVTANTDHTIAFRVKPVECQAQQNRAATTFGFTAVRLHGGVWRFVLTPEQMATLWREAQPL